ncbi:tail fiber assembly protein [Morganella morganii]|uniref:tail fiber assembly protein n=1 Tax=Morganella morganii TaxID=582 RepID=UPI003EBA2A95
MYRFDPEECVFYSYGLKEEYLTAGNWPENGVDISDEERAGFMQKPGFVVGADKRGDPVWIPEPPPTKEQLTEQAETKKQFLLSEANTVISPLQDAVDLDMATAEEEALLKEWKKHRVMLNRVDTSFAPNIIWPEKPE